MTGMQRLTADQTLATLLIEAADEIQWLNLRIQRLEGMA